MLQHEKLDVRRIVGCAALQGSLTIDEVNACRTLRKLVQLGCVDCGETVVSKARVERNIALPEIIDQDLKTNCWERAYQLEALSTSVRKDAHNHHRRQRRARRKKAASRDRQCQHDRHVKSRLDK